MANAIYPLTKQAWLSTGLDLTSVNLKVYVVDGADYTYSASHDMADDVATGAKVATSGNLGSKSVTNGLFDAADVTISAVSGDQSEILIIWYDSGTQSTSRLILYLDTSVTGFPFTPNGGDLQIQWNASGIFQL